MDFFDTLANEGGFMSRIVTIFSMALTLGMAPSNNAFSHANPDIIHICANFNLFPDNAPFAQDFELSGLKFHAVSFAFPWFANQTGAEVGLEFAREGVSITPPVKAARINIRIGTFDGAMDLQAQDGTGNNLVQMTLAGTNTYVDYLIEGNGIEKLILTGGGSEGTISKVCADVPVAEN
ncbi:hypothetical protein NKG95_02750 [Mesorhizobium sp. M1423]|uniref:hypothetical protein n=1 Tax=Mesorhizobium sp. M1423 TaxID=2957101 RepID=UPI0033381329